MVSVLGIVLNMGEEPEGNGRSFGVHADMVRCVTFVLIVNMSRTMRSI
jgi:hypothetical protein